jgi:thiol-disulfide isomerase/thioredoxin
MRTFLLAICVLFCFSCSQEKTSILETGNFRGVLKAKDNQEIPFVFKVLNDSLIHIINGEEIITVTNISYKNDSIRIQTPVFEGYIKAKIHNRKIEKGNFINPSFNRIVPFTTVNTEDRFTIANEPKVDVTGKWETIFSPDNEKNKYLASAIFEQKGNKATGTFITTTGDYRFLEGVVDGDSLKLSVYDGIHVFLFKAKATDSTLNGMFYSGNHWKEPFVAKLNNNYELPIDENITYIKEGYENFDFSFPDSRGKVVSLSDNEFNNNVVLIQIMGSWCPNSLDQTKFLVDYVKENTHENLKVISLDFEIADNRETSYKNIKRLKNEIGITYPVLLAQYGRNGSKKAVLEKLPMLNKLHAYPTLLVLDKDKKVRKIYTSFNGPATKDKYVEFKNEFNNTIDKLLSEIE